MGEHHILFPEQIPPEDWERTPESVKHLVELLLGQTLNQEASSGEARLLQFLEATPIGIAVHDASGHLVYVNSVGQSILGTSHRTDPNLNHLSQAFQIYRSTTQELYPVDELPSTRALAGERAWADDIEIRLPDRTVLLDVWAVPICDEQGQVTYVIATFQDIRDRKQTLEALAASEQRLRTIIEAEPECVKVLTADSTVLEMNQAGLTMLEADYPEQVIGKNALASVHPDHQAAFQRFCQQIFQGETGELEFVIRGLKGTYRWVESHAVPLRNEHQEITSILAITRDITERKQAAIALKQQLQRQQALNRVFQAIRNSLELETIFATATAATAQLLKALNCFVVQYLPQEEIWKHIAEFQHDSTVPSLVGFEIPDTGNPFAERLKRFEIVRVDEPAQLDAINQEIAQSIPGAWLLVPLVVNDTIWGSFTIQAPQSPFQWSDEQVSLAQEVAEQLEIAIHQANLYRQANLELEERRRAETALRESEARFRNMAANVPGAIFRYLLRSDGSDSVLYMSPGCAQLWEVEAEAVEEDATRLWDMVHPNDVADLYGSVLNSAQTLQPWSWAWRIITPSGQEKWLEAAGRPTRYENGDIIWDTLVLDVSDRKRAEQRFQNLAANTPGVIYQYVLHPDGTNQMRYVSPGCRDLWELEPHEVEEDVDRTWAMIDPEALPAMRESMLQSAVTLQPWNWQWQITTPSGRQKWLQASARPQRHANGAIVWDGLILDVSDRKQAELALKQSEQRFRHLFEFTPKIAVQGYNRDRQVIYWNQASEELYGYTKEEAIGQQLEELIIPPEMRQEVIANIQRWLLEKQPIPARELNLLRRDGSQVAVYSSHILLTNTEGEVELYCVDIDLRDRKQAEEALRESEERYRLLAENMNDLVCLHELDGRYLYVSPSCETLLGYQYNELIGRTPYDFFHPDDRDRIYQDAHQEAIVQKPIPITYRMRHKQGHYIWFETLTKPILNEQGQVMQLQTTSRDVTERIQVQKQLQYDALHDTLTGLPNRNLLMERLEFAIQRAKRAETDCYAVLFLDLDRFKVINDSLGHLAGDQLLVAIAQKLRSILRATDLAVRLGGDEFVILLEEVNSIQEVVRATERIFNELRSPLVIKDREVYITTSIGIVLGTPDYTQASDVLRDADIAMYRAKSRGKERYEIFDTDMHRQAFQRLHLENDLRLAIARQELLLHYQPIVALDTGLLVGFEALIRWQHPQQGLKSPGDFVAIAEETGLITQLDYWAMRTACQQLVEWQHRFPCALAMKVNVNLSAQDLRHPHFLQEVDQILAETQINGSCLTLEITESMLIEDVEATIRLLEQIKERRIHISIDDFGTGYSSLSYLHRLPVDSLKVDRSFVNQMQIGRRNNQIVETIMALSHQLELDAIAEGIETQAQRERLQELGYRFGQGYLFSRPLTPENVETLLARPQSFNASLG
jgi:diguanylate cyclase (GGDEF)-like protein/PAS domain S-box-containing protein